MLDGPGNAAKENSSDRKRLATVISRGCCAAESFRTFQLAHQDFPRGCGYAPIMTRRDFLKRSSAVLTTLPAAACVPRMPVRPVYRSLIPDDTSATLVNDVHSQLNPTRVAAIVRPSSVDELSAALGNARATGHAVAVAGGRHAMGGQQFAENADVDTRQMNRSWRSTRIAAS